MNIRRGQICLASLDPVVGKEISRTRPVVIVSNDKNNEFSATVTILPITSKNVQRIYPFEVYLPKGAGNLPKNSKVKADQIRTLDSMRLVKRIGTVEQNKMEILAAVQALATAPRGWPLKSQFSLPTL